MAKYDFTPQEVDVLKKLINIAVKTVGMEAAESALILYRKLDNPIKDEVKKNENKDNGKK